MKKFRFILAMVLVAAMVLSTPLMTFAATWDVTDSAGVENAFATDTDAEVIINMQNDINMEQSVTAGEGQSYIINGNGNTISDVMIFGQGSVEIDADVTAEENGWAVDANEEVSITVTGDVEGVWAGEDAQVTVEGDSTGGIVAMNNASVAVEGDVTDEDYVAVEARDDATVTVGGDVTGEYDAVNAMENATVIVGGDVSGGSGELTEEELQNPSAYSDGSVGVYAYDNATVVVGGNVSGGDAMGTYGWAGDGAVVYDTATLEVGGDVTGGSVVTDPEVEAEYGEEIEAYLRSRGGDGLVVDYEATVTVGGDVSGGSTNGDHGDGGSGIVLNPSYDEDQVAGSVTVEGTVTGGIGGENGEAGAAVEFDTYMEDMEDTDLEGALDAEELTDDQAAMINMAMDYAVENELITQEEVLEIIGDCESEEEIYAVAQDVLKDILDTTNILTISGEKHAPVTAGTISGKSGVAYNSCAGPEQSAEYAKNVVTESAPEAVTPATGDGFQPMMVLAAALVSMMSLCVLVFKKKAA